jgi:hypothetical protein
MLKRLTAIISKENLHCHYAFSRKKADTLEPKTILRPPIHGRVNAKDEKKLDEIVINSYTFYYCQKNKFVSFFPLREKKN